MIILYTGLPRQGKTLNLVFDVAYLIAHGRRVITNTPIWCYVHGRKVPADFYPDAERYTWELLRAHNATIVCDEISLVFSSLRWNRLGLDMFAKFRQAAKQSCDLFGTSQSYVDTVSALRRVTDQVTVCTKRHWLIPFPLLDLRHDVYNDRRGFYERKGLMISTPMVYTMKTVSKGYFSSKAELPQNRARYILRARTLYPSQFRRASANYDHEYEIKFSLVGKMAVFGKNDKFVEKEVHEVRDTTKKSSNDKDPTIVKTGTEATTDHL